MKRLVTGILLLFLFFQSNSQGVYNFWGLTTYGENENNGRLFFANAAAENFTVKFNFTDEKKGVKPFGDLVMFNGKMYGITSEEATGAGGIIFSWDPANQIYTEEYRLSTQPASVNKLWECKTGLTVWNNKFYGLTNAGGNAGMGGIFEYDPTTKIFLNKYTLNGFSGSEATGKFAVSNNKMYAFLRSNPSFNAGSIIEFDPATASVIRKHLFTSTDIPTVTNWATGGAYPSGTPVFINDKMYGYTTAGGNNNKGLIFQFDLTNDQYAVQYHFNGTDGEKPENGGMTIYNGKLYGITKGGGVNNSGVIFEWNPQTTIYTKKIDLTAANGEKPMGMLHLQNGKFYGTASAGGNNNKGVIFEWDPVQNIYNKKIDLSNQDGASPAAGVNFYNGKFFGLTPLGGNNAGVLFEWDNQINLYSKKIAFNTNNGKWPNSSLTLYNGIYYGMAGEGGNDNAGVIFQFDPESEKFKPVYQFDVVNGSKPYGKLFIKDGLMYGMTALGGSQNKGVIFEFNPVTKAVTTKINFDDAKGANPNGSLVLLNNVFYGLTTNKGINDRGTFFSWNPVNNAFTKLSDEGSAATPQVYANKIYGTTQQDFGTIFEYDPAMATLQTKITFTQEMGWTPVGQMAILRDTFYGLTNTGGQFGGGSLYQWVPASNNFVRKISFDGNNGQSPYGSLTVSQGKLYGMTYAGGNLSGGNIFEYDPNQNVINVKHEFEINGGIGNAEAGNDIILMPALVSKGTPGNCVSYTDIFITADNANVWVPVMDNNGKVIAEIKANGNILGQVQTSFYVHNNAVREDAQHQLYADRNITFIPQIQPTSNVDIRLYLRNDELNALRNASNSLGAPSGVNGINDVAIFKNADGCSDTKQNSFVQLITGRESWSVDHVLTANVNELTTFYFANKSIGGVIAINELQLQGNLVAKDAVLNWQATGENTAFDFAVERSVDGRNFTTVGNVAGRISNNRSEYQFRDMNAASTNSNNIYYRIRQYSNTRTLYSNIIRLQPGKNQNVQLYPNPVKENATLKVISFVAETVTVRLIDMSGKLVKTFTMNLQPGINANPFNAAGLATGMYMLEVKGKTTLERLPFIKQ